MTQVQSDAFWFETPVPAATASAAPPAPTAPPCPTARDVRAAQTTIAKPVRPEMPPAAAVQSATPRPTEPRRPTEAPKHRPARIEVPERAPREPAVTRRPARIVVPEATPEPPAVTRRPPSTAVPNAISRASIPRHPDETTAAPIRRHPTPGPQAPWELTVAAFNLPSPPELTASRLPATPAVPNTGLTVTPLQSWGWSERWGFDTSEHALDSYDEPGGRERSGRRPWILLGLLLAGALVVVAIIGLSGTSTGTDTISRASSAAARTARRTAIRAPRVATHAATVATVHADPQPSAYAVQTIPAAYLKLYVRAGDEYGLDWTILAAIGQIESDSGRSQLPGVASGTNSAGAAGPAQFELRTWQRFGIDADGRGQSNPYDPVDAITTMAAYLKASGAPQSWEQALMTYNHSQSYVDAVLALSERFGGSGGT